MKVYQVNPLNLMTVYNNKDGIVYSKIIGAAMDNFFHGVVIGQKGNSKYHTISAIVPFISLFTNKKYREQFLAYTATSTDESVIRLRTVLMDEILRKRNYLLMVESIGDICKRCNFKEYEYNAFAYTFANYRKDGERIRYYINTEGVESKDKGVKDLTGAYKLVKEYRAKGNQVSSEIVDDKIKRA